VLELPAHAIFRSRTEVGDQLVIERYEARQPTASDSADTAIDPQDSGEDLIHSSPVIPSAEAAFTEPEGAAASQEPLPQKRPMQRA
jgi:hypothetical protein